MLDAFELLERLFLSKLVANPAGSLPQPPHPPNFEFSILNFELSPTLPCNPGGWTGIQKFIIQNS
jgi:hypothetical protein